MYSEQHVEIASFHTLLDKARHGARYVFETMVIINLQVAPPSCLRRCEAGIQSSLHSVSIT